MMMPMMNMMPMMGKGGWGKGGWGNGDWQSGQNMKCDESGGVIGEFVGTIKSFSDKSGYGFIECPEIKSQYEKDCFVVGSEKKGYRIGHKVRFTAVLNKDGAPGAKGLKSGLK